MKDRALTEPVSKTAMRHAMEIRHKSFVTPEFIDLLRKYQVAIVCADAVEWPKMMDVTSDFVYCRLHGSEELYASGYSDAALDEWAARIAAWARGDEKPRDVFAYFDNDTKVRAPFDALGLIERVNRLVL